MEDKQFLYKCILDVLMVECRTRAYWNNCESKECKKCFLTGCMELIRSEKNAVH